MKKKNCDGIKIPKNSFKWYCYFVECTVAHSFCHFKLLYCIKYSI